MLVVVLFLVEVAIFLFLLGCAVILGALYLGCLLIYALVRSVYVASKPRQQVMK